MVLARFRARPSQGLRHRALFCPGAWLGSVAKNPLEARHFNNHVDMERGKIWKRAVGIDPDIETPLTSEEIQALEDRYSQAKTRRNTESVGPK
jgi:hypothetical protein